VRWRVRRLATLGRGPDALAALARAQARLDRLDLYPSPVRTDRVRILHAPWFFRIPGLRRFRGYEAGPLILLKMPVAEAPDDLVVHELVHVWQDQHRRWRMWLSYLGGYKNNRHEVEARRAVAITRPK
jgi:hypothetical protein